MLRLLLRLICNPSWRAWSMSLKPNGWTDNGETETQRNDESDWNLVTFIDIPGAWCLNHQPFIIPSPPRNLFELFLFPARWWKHYTNTALIGNPFFLFKVKWNSFWKCTSSDQTMKALLEKSNHGSWTYQRGCWFHCGTWTDFNGD